MTEPGPPPDASKGARRITLLLCAAWTVAFLGAFVAFYLTPSKDFGLSAGWNRVGVFMGWQAVAAVLAILTAVAARAVPSGHRMRWIGLVPMGVLSLMATGVVALFVWTNMQRTPPDGPVPAASTTAPVATPQAETGPVLEGD